MAVAETIDTEGEAAEYIRALMRRLHAKHPQLEPVAHSPRKSKSDARSKRPQSIRKTKKAKKPKAGKR